MVAFRSTKTVVRRASGMRRTIGGTVPHSYRTDNDLDHISLIPEKLKNPNIPSQVTQYQQG